LEGLLLLLKRRDYTESLVAAASTALAVWPALAVVVLQRYSSTMPHFIAGLQNTVHLEALLLGALSLVSAVTICAIGRHVGKKMTTREEEATSMESSMLSDTAPASQSTHTQPYI